MTKSPAKSAAETEYDNRRRQLSLDAKNVTRLRAQLASAEGKLTASQAKAVQAQMTAVALKNNLEAFTGTWSFAATSSAFNESKKK